MKYSTLILAHSYLQKCNKSSHLNPSQSNPYLNSDVSPFSEKNSPSQSPWSPHSYAQVLSTLAHFSGSQMPSHCLVRPSGA